jgi:hypothetical protein
MHIVIANFRRLVLIIDSKIRTVLIIYGKNQTVPNYYLREVELNHRTFKKYGFFKNTIKILKISPILFFFGNLKKLKINFKLYVIIR